MERTDLGGYDGMLFKFATDTTGAFYMKDTPMPLSIALFDAAGRFVSSTDMEPCLDQPTCPTYAADRPLPLGAGGPQGPARLPGRRPRHPARAQQRHHLLTATLRRGGALSTGPFSAVVSYPPAILAG